MKAEARSQVHQALISRCHAIADDWYQAIARTNHVPHSAAEVRQRLIELTKQTIAFLFTEPFERGQAEAIGASLAGLRYIEPEVLGQTQEVLAQQLIEGLSADQVAALQPRLAALLGGLTTGFSRQARETVLAEQEWVRGALTAALRQAKEAVQRAYEEVEQQVQERTAELRAANEQLKQEITERKWAEDALRESEERFRGIFENATIGLYRTAPDGRILMANPTLVRMLGYSSFDELVQRNLEENGYEPEYPRTVFKQRIESEGQVFGLESVWVRRDGTPLFIRESARAFRDEAGNTLYYEGTVEDITERKWAEEALRKAHDELEMRVQERTADLAQANESLRLERDLAEALAEAAAVVSSTLDPNQVLDRILAQVSRVVPNDAANVMLIEKNDQAHIARWRGYERFGAEEFVSKLAYHVPEIPSLQQMIDSGKPMVIPDTATFPCWVHVPEMEWLRAYAAAPIAVHGQVIGFLNVDSATPGFFTRAHAEALRAFADYAAAAIENARLFEQARQEIAERKQAEKSLKASEERYRTLFEGVPVGLYRTTPDGRFLDANPALVQILGYPDRESLLTIRVADTYINIEDRRWWQEAMEQEGVVRDFDRRNRRADGTIIWIRGDSRVVQDADGRVLYYEGSVQDITERKRAEEELRDREATMRALLNAPIESAILMDASGTILALNETAAKSLGKSTDKLVGVCGYDLLPPAVAKSRKAQVDRVFRSGAPVRFEDERGGRSFDNSLYPIFDAQGKVARIAAYARDITYHKQAEERLLTYQARLRSLASQLSLTEERERRRIAMALHDRVGQTLAISKMKLGALRQLASATELAEPLDEIHEFIEEIIRDTRSLTFELSSPILYQLGLEAALEWLTEQTQHRHGILSYFEDDGQPKPLDDDVRILLFQAVRELLVNVAKHAQARSVKVAMQRDGSDVQIIVEDDGVGFDAFPIGPHESEIKGFGLFSIRERLDHIGGQLKIVSTPGHGAQVTIVAPLKRVSRNQ